MDIIFDHVSKAFGEKQVLCGFSHRFPEGEISCILGPSGCGKTTLLRLIAGLETPDSGSISGLENKKISAVFQENRLFENLTVLKNLMLTARRGFTPADAQALLDALGIGSDAHALLKKLSGGMQRRVAVARALAADYDLLLLDEPLTGLDGEARRQTMDVIRREAAGRTLVWVSHEPSDAMLLNAGVLRLN